MEAKELTPQELRIGNWVYFTDFPVKNNPIQLKQRDLYLENWVMYFCSPIPLTQEWLEKFGFKYWPPEWQGEILMEEDSDGFLRYTGGEGVYLSDPIKYVHQLQNLTFALTGKELTLNT